VSQAATAAQAGEAGPLRVGAALAGVVLAAVILFSLGVMTGTRIAANAPAVPAATAAAIDVPVPAVVPPASVLQATSPPTGPAGTLTFYDRLSGAAPPLPAIQPDDSAERAASAAPAPPAEKPLPHETAPPPARPPVPAAPVGGDTGARVRGLMAKGPYAVQVAALSDRQAATAAAERLKAQGLPAATIAVKSKGKTWYRLRVGSFPTREAADRAAGLLHAELGLDATPVRD
jgi:DedD protein